MRGEERGEEGGEEARGVEVRGGGTRRGGRRGGVRGGLPALWGGRQTRGERRHKNRSKERRGRIEGRKREATEQEVHTEATEAFQDAPSVCFLFLRLCR